MSARVVARLGMLCAVALALGYVEALLPVAPGIPGVKLGLANTVLLYAVMTMRKRDCAALMLAKVLLSGLIYAGVSAMLYSLCGGAASLLAMLAARRGKGVTVVGVSVTGAVAHNAGQLALAAFVVGARPALGYAPILIAAGVATGAVTGVVARMALRAMGGNACGGGD